MLARCQKKTLKLKILKKKEHHQLKTFKKQEIVKLGIWKVKKIENNWKIMKLGKLGN